MHVHELEIKGGPIIVEPLGDRFYKVARDTEIIVRSDSGDMFFSFETGFVTNFRSGGILVDPFVDQMGNNAVMRAAYLCHDATYTPCAMLDMKHPVSRKVADDMLRGILIYGGMPRFKAGLVYRSVRLFGKPAYENDDELTPTNSKLFSFKWDT